MSSLPLLPGYTFMDPVALQKPIKQSLGWKKGVPLVKPGISAHSLRDEQSRSCSTGTFPAVRCSASLENSAQIPARMGCPGEEGIAIQRLFH
ncbi:uncharacterized protein LOC119588333 isoform X2 [Penaeus monodon]|uniref:uncharacterized protein LOC119588333 isoform X2 n=1 Tax=Penaeus monodon TaxID=6687 RepID=UPI0018A780BE|nr:uncharacterized protein LOC119588333 isoform X2 [Penaeus monodon]